LNHAYRLALQRSPKQAEATILLALYEKHLADFTSDQAGALQLLGIGDKPVGKDVNPAELAAWTSVTRVILNLHETVTRE